MDTNLLEVIASEDADMDVADSTTGLTKRERIIVQSTWNIACKMGATNVGVALFELYFHRKPTYMKLFKSIFARDISIDKLKNHPRLKAHGTRVVQSISGIIENLDDSETTVLLLEQNGRNHAHRALHDEHFQELQITILLLLENALGSGTFTPVVKSSWDKALTVVMTVVKSAMIQEEYDINESD